MSLECQFFTIIILNRALDKLSVLQSINLLIAINENYMVTLVLKYHKQLPLLLFINSAWIILVFVNGFTFEQIFLLSKLIIKTRIKTKI